jgi:hypothetical protein
MARLMSCRAWRPWTAERSSNSNTREYRAMSRGWVTVRLAETVSIRTRESPGEGDVAAEGVLRLAA